MYAILGLVVIAVYALTLALNDADVRWLKALPLIRMLKNAVSIGCVAFVVELGSSWLYWVDSTHADLETICAIGSVEFHDDTIQWLDKQSRWWAETPYTYPANNGGYRYTARGGIPHLNPVWWLTCWFAILFGIVGSAVVEFIRFVARLFAHRRARATDKIALDMPSS